MITKTEGIVLKSMNYRDTSKIVTFYTRRYGKLKCIAKGARQAKSKFGAGLEPITNVALVLYKKEHRDLQLVTQCDAIKSYKRIHSELERMAVALGVLELVNQLVHEEEEHNDLFQLLLDTLDEIERAKKNFLNLLFAFEIRCASLFGFAPNLETCSSCGRSLDELAPDGSAIFQLSKGAILCGRCGMAAGVSPTDEIKVGRGSPGFKAKASRDEGNVRVSIGALRYLRTFLTARLESIPLFATDTLSGNEIDGTLRLYLRQHFGELKPLRSLEILKNPQRVTKA